MEKTRQIVGLDYLRFVAAFLVMSFHLSFYCWIANYSNIGADHGVWGMFPTAYSHCRWLNMAG